MLRARFPASPLSSVFANAAGTLARHFAGYVVLHYRPGLWDRAALTPLLTELAGLLLAESWHRLFIDSRLMPVLPPEVREWMTTQWLNSLLPRPERLCIALLPAANVLARLAASDARTLSPATTQYSYFGTEADAHAFLLGLKGAAEGLALFPNPAHAGAATLTGAVPDTLVTIFDALGRFVTSAPADAAGTAALALPAGLPTGVYVVRAGRKAVRLTVE